MGINFGKLQEAIDNLDPEKRKEKAQNGNKDRVSLEEGETTIRIVPYKYDEDLPFQEKWFHYGIGGKNFLCPKRNFGEDCPVCNFARKCWEEFNSTQDETFKELAKAMSATCRVFIPIVVRGEEDKGVRWWAITGNQTPKGTYGKLLNCCKMAFKRDIDVSDPDSGMDITVDIQKGYNGWLIPETFQLDIGQTPLAKNKTEAKKLINGVKNVDELYEKTPSDEISAALEEHLNPNQKPSDATGTVKNFGSAQEEDPDDLPFDDEEEKVGVTDADALDAKLQGILNKKK